MKSLTATFSILMSMLSNICLTSCLKKSMGLFSLISPGYYICSIITFSCCSFIDSLKFSANCLLGLKSNSRPSIVTSMLFEAN